MEGLVVAHAVGMRQLTVDHVRKDLGISMWVATKAVVALNKVVVDHTEGMEVLTCGYVAIVNKSHIT